MREAAARAQCQNNLKQIMLGLHNYHDVHRHLPMAAADAPGVPAAKRLSWLAAILPYVDQPQLASQIRWESAWDGEENRGHASTSLSVYRCPANPAPPAADTHYVGLSGIGADALALAKDHPRAGAFGFARRITLKDIKDGAGVTIVVIETTADNGPWAAGGWNTVRSLAVEETDYIGVGRPFGLKHKDDTFFRSNPQLANAAFADGTVRSIPAGVAPEVLRALVTIAGGEEVNVDF